MKKAAKGPADFAEAVLTTLSKVPHGRVTTYGELARLAGYPGAARAVGRLMSQARRPGLPYHRVVAAGGKLGGFGGDPAFKAQRLAAEGVVVARDRIRNFAQVLWPGARASGRPTAAR